MYEQAWANRPQPSLMTREELEQEVIMLREVLRECNQLVQVANIHVPKKSPVLPQSQPLVSTYAAPLHPHHHRPKRSRSADEQASTEMPVSKRTRYDETWSNPDQSSFSTMSPQLQDLMRVPISSLRSIQTTMSRKNSL